jgi:hypothetical protein
LDRAAYASRESTWQSSARGQFLVVIPQHGIVGVVNSWKVFGARVPGSLGPFIDALIAAAQPAG